MTGEEQPRDDAEERVDLRSEAAKDSLHGASLIVGDYTQLSVAGSRNHPESVFRPNNVGKSGEP